MSQKAGTIGDKVLTLSFLSERPEAQSTKALSLCMGLLTGRMSSLWGKKKDIKSERGEFQFHGNYEAGEALL